MTERMKELVGRLEVTSGSWGTSVKATLPLGSQNCNQRARRTVCRPRHFRLKRNPQAFTTAISEQAYT